MYNLRAKLVKTFRNREVLVFPQSVDFNSKDIAYLFRDHMSYDIIVKSGLYKYKELFCALMQLYRLE